MLEVKIEVILTALIVVELGLAIVKYRLVI